jgi:hypothetical protein
MKIVENDSPVAQQNASALMNEILAAEESRE